MTNPYKAPASKPDSPMIPADDKFVGGWRMTLVVSVCGGLVVTSISLFAATANESSAAVAVLAPLFGVIAGTILVLVDDRCTFFWKTPFRYGFAMFQFACLAFVLFVPVCTISPASVLNHTVADSSPSVPGFIFLGVGFACVSAMASRMLRKTLQPTAQSQD